LKANSGNNQFWPRLLQGDRQALNEIYRLHADALFRYGIRLLHDENAVQDCIHDLFLKIWSNHARLSDTDNVRYYLISSLRNTIINYRNQQGKIEHQELQERDGFAMDFTVESQYILKEEQTEKAQRLAEAMNQLTARQKEIIYLRYFEELSYDQIAEMMDLSKKGTYKLSARALEALREILQVEKAVLIALLVSLKH